MSILDEYPHMSYDFDDHSCSCFISGPCSHCTDCLEHNLVCIACDDEHDGPRNENCPSLIKVTTMISESNLQNIYNRAINDGEDISTALSDVARAVAEDCAKTAENVSKDAAVSIRDDYELTVKQTDDEDDEPETDAYTFFIDSSPPISMSEADRRMIQRSIQLSHDARKYLR